MSNSAGVLLAGARARKRLALALDLPDGGDYAPFSEPIMHAIVSTASGG